MKKIVTFLLLTVLTCMGLFLGIPQAQAAQSLALSYDDRKELSALVGEEITSVEISNQKVTSLSVGTQTADDAVLSYEQASGTLYAVGTGTATLTVNGTAYEVTVRPARLTMFLITGHSVGWGEAGTPGQSVAVEAGQAYSSWFRTSLTSAEGGLGYGASVRAGTGTDEYGLDAFAQGQYGTRGVGSGLAYQYNKLTGDKVWVINLAIPGSCINEWLPGQEGHHANENYKYKYESVLEVFGNAQQIAKNEIAAGHYTLGEVSMLYFCGANFGNAGYNDCTFVSLKSDYHTFWEGLKEDLALDMDGDGQTETLESMGFVPFWSASSRTYATDKAVAFYMAASAEYPNVYMAHTRYRNWTVASGLSDFPAIDYTTQGTAVAAPTSVQHANQGGSSTDSVFCQKDTTHPSQVTYNAIGMDMAEHIHAWYTGDTTITAAALRTTGYTDLAQVTLSVGQSYTMVPAITPITGNGMTLELSSNLEAVFPLGFQATAVGTGTATVKNHLGEALASVTVNVVEHSHCICGGHAESISGHTCADQNWTAWTSTTSLPTTTGYYYLTSDVSMTAVNTIAAGQDVKLCLNGHDVTSTARPYSVKGNLTVTDCKPQAEWGSISSTVSTTYGGIFYVYDSAVLNLYGGRFDASAASIHMGGVAIVGNATSATMNIYGGILTGGTLVKSSSNTNNTRGGVLYVISSSTVNIYGGTLNGGTAMGGGAVYMAIGKLNLRGGTVTGGTGTVNGGNLYVGGSSAGVNIYDGTVSAGTTVGHGGNIYAAAKTKVHFYAGALVSGGETYSSGGNLYALSSETVLEGAAVRDGRATAAGGNILACHSLTVKDSTVFGGVAGSNGGNLWLDVSVQANISGTVIADGIARNKGGNLFMMNKGTLNVSDSTVSGGFAEDNGGNLYIFREMEQANTSLVRPAVTLNNTLVTGGYAKGLGGGIYLHESDLTLSGDTNIWENPSSNLYLDAADQVQLENLSSTAQIGVSMSVAGTVTADTQYADSLISDAGLTVRTEDGKVTLGQVEAPAISAYSVGWYRGVITPAEPMPLDGMGNNDGRMDSWNIVTELEAGFTVIADSTGIENAILLVSVDTLFIQKELSDNLAACIEDATGIPANRIFFSASHTHCGVDHDATYDQTKHYLEWLYPTMTEYAVQAVADLKPASMEIASVEVESSSGQVLSNTRRYVDADGNAYSSVDGNVPSGTEYESVPDRTMQLLRFKREGGQDVILTNWQAHPGFMTNKNTGNVSGEQWLTFRQSVEEQLPNTVCTFFIGAAGNINSQRTEGSFIGADGNTYSAKDMEGFGDALASFAVTTLEDADKVTAVEAGALKVKNFVFETSELYKDTMQAYKNIDLDLNVISIGEVAFITAPYEMFHENGDQIKSYAQSLGFEMCFILTNSGGENKYIASEQAFTNDETDGELTSFEVRTCRFVKGTAEKLGEKYQQMLAELAE